MHAVDLIRRLHQHRQWVNQKVLSAAAGLTQDQLQQPFAVGQGSIWKSLLHMLAAEYVWLATMQGNENPIMPGDVLGRLPGNQAGEGGLRSFTDLQTKWAEVDRNWNDYLATLASESLDDVIYKVPSFGQGKRQGTKRADVLLHVCTHAHYTTAQVVNMLRQAGLQKLPDAMLISLARQEMAG